MSKKHSKSINFEAHLSDKGIEKLKIARINDQSKIGWFQEKQNSEKLVSFGFCEIQADEVKVGCASSERNLTENNARVEYFKSIW